MVKRNARLAFFGGYFAFPGGTLEEQDREVVVSHLPHFEESLKQDYPLFLAAAARELFEETGVWLARGSSAPSGERLREYRRQMLSGQIRFSQILKREDQHLDGSDFTPICRITTPPFTPERYDTWFLRCQMPVGEEVEIWPGELDEGYFITAEEVLERWRRGEVLVVPPVLILLQELAGRDCQSFLP
ncbi:MAG: MBL fold metallo-hydrolase, partial [Acidobacteriota bacterium]